MHVEKLARQLNFTHMMGIKQALIRQVMHRKYRLRRTAAGRQIRRYQARMPVMGMHNLRTPERIQPAGHFTAHPTQQRETLHVIGIGVHVGVVVRAPWTIVEMRRINQVNANAVIMAEQQRHAPGKSLATGNDFGIGNPTANVRKRRQQHACVGPFCNLCRRQRADNIRKAARF